MKSTQAAKADTRKQLQETELIQLTAVEVTACQGRDHVEE